MPNRELRLLIRLRSLRFRLRMTKPATSTEVVGHELLAQARMPGTSTLHFANGDVTTLANLP